MHVRALAAPEERPQAAHSGGQLNRLVDPIKVNHRQTAMHHAAIGRPAANVLRSRLRRSAEKKPRGFVIERERGMWPCGLGRADLPVTHLNGNFKLLHAFVALEAEDSLDASLVDKAVLFEEESGLSVWARKGRELAGDRGDGRKGSSSALRKDG